MSKLKLVTMSVVMAVGGLVWAAPAAVAAPPEHCDTGGELPDLCKPIYDFCQTKIGQKVCTD